MDRNANNQADYRYPGLHPFCDNDIDHLLFFGRDTEKDILLHKTLADNLVVLYARSGLGKTSLLNAGLNQALRKRGFIPLMVRLNDPKIEPVQRIYAGIKEIVMEKHLEVEIGEEASLWQYFKTTYFWSAANKILKPVLILDHFEEFFSLYSASSREEFTRQLTDVLDNKIPDTVLKSMKPDDPIPYDDTPPNVKIIISIREDYFGRLEEMSRIIPDILHHPFRLLPLNRKQARDAITKPAEFRDESIMDAPFNFKPDAVEMMLDYLCKRKEFNKIKMTEEVESAQLQLLCRHYEEKAREREKIEGRHIIIETEDLGGEAGMQLVLRQFYDKQIEQLTSADEKESARKLCQDGLISVTDLRLSLEEGEILRKFDISKELLQKLVDCRLLRVEPRVGSFYYELTHDTLVGPIRESQKERISIQKSIDTLFEEAGNLKTKSDYDGAFQKYKAIIDIDITCVNAYLELGQTYYETYRYKEAIETYNLAIANGIKDALIYYRLGNVLYDAARIDEANQNYETSIKIDPNLSMPYEGLGDISRNNNDFKKAADYYRDALKINEKKADIYRKLAVSHIKNNEPEIGIEIFKKALEVNPGYMDIYDDIADAFNKKRFYDFIEEITMIAYQSGSQKASHYFNFGNNYTELKKYDQAIKSYQKAIELDPQYSNAYCNLGYVYIILGQLMKINEPEQYEQEKDLYQKAAENLNKAIEFDRKNSQAYNNIGIALRKLKRYDEMLDNFQKAIDNNPDNFVAYINRGAILKKMGRNDEAMADYKKASELDPKSFYAYYKLGLSYNDLKKYKKAITDYKKQLKGKSAHI